MKVTRYDISLSDAYITCSDVPSSVCSEMACSECPFCNEDISIIDLIIMFMEVYNADN